MVDVRRSVAIARPVQGVFNYLIDLPSHSEWVSRGRWEQWYIHTEETRPGTRFMARSTTRDRVREYEGEVTRVEPNRLLSFTLRGENWREEDTFTLEPQDGETVLTWHMRVSPGVLRSLMAPLLRVILANQMFRSLNNLKARVEARARAGEPAS